MTDSVIITAQELQGKIQKLTEFLVAAITTYYGYDKAFIEVTEEEKIMKMTTLLTLHSLRNAMLKLLKEDDPDWDWPSFEAELAEMK